MLSGEKSLYTGWDVKRVLWLTTPLLLFFCAAVLAGQTAPDWTEQSPQTSPPARFDQAMAYDSAHSQAVLLGGGLRLASTWTWNGGAAANTPTIGGHQYVVAQLLDGTYVLPAGAIAGSNSRPAKPGETIVIYGVGFGAVMPNIPAGQIVTESNQLSTIFKVQFGQSSPQVPGYYGLAPSLVGVYQFNIEVPAVADDDLVPLTFSLGGVPGTQTLFTAVHR